ncbi:hypothetical protein TCAL_02434 [Tigriopus californicus]|uniref:Uncharacterized protein n=1 Tax=Tigriopus californicus TaxID=6832 RepID=A0A553NY38_TIGCA|nr:hypothetical protein TCAL_02434 [Tigriopus californicus]
MFRRSESLAPNDGNPYSLTRQEMAMLDPNYKKPRRKKFLNQEKDVELREKVDPTRLHEAKTVSSYRKQRVSEDVDELWNDIESSDGDYEDGSISDDDLCDPTYELIALKRSNEEKQTLKELVTNSKKKFRTKYSLMVKQNETHRLERVLRNEEEQLQKAEAEFRLAQQAFDQFLQANDSKAIQAQKSTPLFSIASDTLHGTFINNNKIIINNNNNNRAETETQVRLEKVADIKGIDEHLVALKREINKKKDVLVEYATFETFLFSLSPEAWRMVQSDKTYQNKSGSFSLQDSYPLLPKDSPDSSIANNDMPIDSLLEITAQELGIPFSELAKVKDNVKLYFTQPQQLLSLFADLEVENLDLIDQCQRAEDQLVEVKKMTKEVIDRLNEQAANFENGILALEQKIQNEGQILMELESSMTGDDESQSVDHVNLFHDRQRMVKFASSTLEGHTFRSKDRKGQDLSPEDEMLIGGSE